MYQYAAVCTGMECTSSAVLHQVPQAGQTLLSAYILTYIPEHINTSKYFKLQYLCTSRVKLETWLAVHCDFHAQNQEALLAVLKTNFNGNKPVPDYD
jgi:hypothetical protein